ncbi:MAG: class I SAM-dependent methyltransferase [Acidimicrobiaceae bacterium]|nr:class I SAM-dependent methyltransferase [Acidimicrobiaceae bacterium]
MNAADQWAKDLAAWAIPDDIMAQAPESPWIHPAVLFQIPDTIPDSISHQRAREVLGPDSSVLDVGCGGGIAAFALTPPVTYVVGVDHQAEMLEMFTRNAAERGLRSDVVEGFFPAVADCVPETDVVVSHHVAYNVADIDPFVRALSQKARRRVVIEMPQSHPLASMGPAWRHFWDLERPSGPHPEDFVQVVRDAGFSPQLELFDGAMRREQTPEQAAHFMRIRLCLPASREGEVGEFLASQPPVTSALACVWWDL